MSKAKSAKRTVQLEECTGCGEKLSQQLLTSAVCGHLVCERCDLGKGCVCPRCDGADE